MRYKLIVTEKAEKQLEHILDYLVIQLCNSGAAKKLLEEISRIYDFLEENPMIYAYCRDSFLESRGYRQATVKYYSYSIIYKVDESERCVYILGIFHDLENYNAKFHV